MSGSDTVCGGKTETLPVHCWDCRGIEVEGCLLGAPECVALTVNQIMHDYMRAKVSEHVAVMVGVKTTRIPFAGTPLLLVTMQPMGRYRPLDRQLEELEERLAAVLGPGIIVDVAVP